MTVRWISDAVQDVGFALRLHRTQPGFVLLAVLTLAFGIGATTAVYTFVHAVLLRALPFADSDRLVMVWDNAPQDGDRFKAIMVSRADVDEYAKSSRTLERFSSAGRIRPVLHYGGITKRAMAGLVTTAMFRDTLGSRPLLGRTFVDEDRKAGCVVVLANGFWTRVLGGDAGLVGKHLTFDETLCEVTGVMPAGFDLFPISADMWFLRDHAPRASVEVARRGGWLDDGIVYARLKDGFTPEQAERDLTALHQGLHANDAPEEHGERGRVAAVTPIRSAMASVTAPSLNASLRLAFGAVALLLLIACVNVANLLMGRLPDRRRELSVRAALGSGRARLIRQLISEGFLLAAAGTGLGVALAWAGVRWFRYLSPFELPTQAGNVGLNPRVLLFAVALSVATTMLFALLPAFAGSSVDLSQGLRAAGRGLLGRAGQKRASQAMVAIEVALSFILVTGAGLLMTSVFHLESEQLGFDVGGVATVYAEMPNGRYATRASREAFERTLRARLLAMPRVTNVSFGYLPPNIDGGEAQVEIQGHAVEQVFDVDVRAGSREYLEILRVPILQGRGFEDSDRTGRAIAIVSQRFVDEYLKGADPIGRSIQVINGDVRGEWRAIVGVIGTWKHMVGDTVWRDTPVVFTMGGTPRDAGAGYGVWAGVRSDGDVTNLPREIQRQIVALEPNAVLQESEVLSERLSKMTVYPRFRAMLLAVFGAGALLFAAVGVYGVVAQVVVQRTPEFGVRRAVGAQSVDLAWLVLRHGGAAAVIGLSCGVIAALVGARVIQGLVYGVAPRDPVVFGVAGLVLCVSALGAMAVPAVRAAQVDPISALRQE
jgi:putative ABC transport system permease protein